MQNAERNTGRTCASSFCIHHSDFCILLCILPSVPPCLRGESPFTPLKEVVNVDTRTTDRPCHPCGVSPAGERRDSPGDGGGRSAAVHVRLGEGGMGQGGHQVVQRLGRDA